MSESRPKVIATVACDLEVSPIGTRSRLLEKLGDRTVLQRMLDALGRVPAIDSIVLMAPEAQQAALRDALAQDATSPVGRPLNKVEIIPLIPRHEFTERRVRIGRAWNLGGWRGGAGQWTVFDEDYHPAAIGAACKQFAADHVLSISAHAALLDADLVAALIHHHIHKNHEMRVTYTPAAPGLCGMILRADIVMEMDAAGVTPMHLLGYDPNNPSFDTLIRDACMQVDPALSKIPNRFLVDTERSWQVAEKLLAGPPWDCSASLAVAARDFAIAERFHQPRELQIELTARRATDPPGAVPAYGRKDSGATTTQRGRAVSSQSTATNCVAVAPPDPLHDATAELEPSHWQRWFARQKFADDLLLTFGGDGDPLLYPDFISVLRAARAAGARNIHLQTDLLELPETLLSALDDGLLDVISVYFYGDDAPIYAAVSGHDGYAAVSANIEKLLAYSKQTLVVPRLLKVRQTIPHLEQFFDRWVRRVGWAVIDGPTDRAGAVEFAGVVDMAPPKRRACRRLADRFVITAAGKAVACDQDIQGRLALGHIENSTLEQMWLGQPFVQLRTAHSDGAWNHIIPCSTCREWHRA